MACAGRRQRQAQAKRCDDPLAPTKPRLFATGVEQRFRKHPLELVRDHAKLSRIHLRLLSLSFKQHAQEEFRMDRNKNPQQNQILKSTYLCTEDELLKAIGDLWKSVGRRPTEALMNSEGAYTIKPYRVHWGNFRKAI